MRRIVVTIHGTGRTSRTFASSRIQAIASHLGTTPYHYSVWWGDLIDVGAPIAKLGAWVDGRLHALVQIFTGHPLFPTPHWVSRVTDWLHRYINGIAGIVTYFTSAPKREIIRNRLHAALGELSGHGFEIVLVSESLGCLVAYDVLRSYAHKFNIAAWITLGSPLRAVISAGQRDANLGAINPENVKEWINFYSPLDPVAAPLAPVFPQYPIRDECVDGALDNVQAHYYWHNPRVPARIARVLHRLHLTK